MFAMLGGHLNMRSVVLMRCCNVDHLDVGQGTQSFNAVDRDGLKIFFKLRSGCRNRIGGCHQLNTRVLQECRQHQSEGPAQASNAYFDA